MPAQPICRNRGNRAAKIAASYRNPGFTMLAEIHSEIRAKSGEPVMTRVEEIEAERVTRQANRRKTDASVKRRGVEPFGYAGGLPGDRLEGVRMVSIVKPSEDSLDNAPEAE